MKGLGKANKDGDRAERLVRSQTGHLTTGEGHMQTNLVGWLS